MVINRKGVVQKQTTALLFQQLCATCHGNHLQGTERTQSILGGKFVYGSDKASVIKNITNGITAKGMPAWNGAISTKDINKLANYVLAMSGRKK